MGLSVPNGRKTEGVIGDKYIAQGQRIAAIPHLPSRQTVWQHKLFIQFNTWYTQLSNAFLLLKTEEKMIAVTSAPPDKYFDMRISQKQQKIKQNSASSLPRSYKMTFLTTISVLTIEDNYLLSYYYHSSIILILLHSLFGVKNLWVSYLLRLNNRKLLARRRFS
jgi:hypothetical protein